MRVFGDSSTFTRWPSLTRSGNFCQPSVRWEFETNAGESAAPVKESGPTTRLRGLVKAWGKSAPDWVEQFSTAVLGCFAGCPLSAQADAPVIAAAAITMGAVASTARTFISARITPVDGFRFRARTWAPGYPSRRPCPATTLNSNPRRIPAVRACSGESTLAHRRERADSKVMSCWGVAACAMRLRTRSRTSSLPRTTATARTAVQWLARLSYRGATSSARNWRWRGVRGRCSWMAIPTQPMRCAAGSASRFSIGLHATATFAFRTEHSSTSPRSSRKATCSSGRRLRGTRFSTTFLNTTNTRGPDHLRQTRLPSGVIPKRWRRPCCSMKDQVGGETRSGPGAQARPSSSGQSVKPDT